MTTEKKSKAPFVAGLEPVSRPSVLEKAPAAQLNVRRVKRCPVCAANPGTVEVSVGPMLVRICSMCFERYERPVKQAFGLLEILQRFL